MSRKQKDQKTEQVAPPPYVHELDVATLSRAAPRAFDLMPDAHERAVIARYLGLVELSALRMRGALIPAGTDGWRLEARLTADLAQACVATLVPVPARIDIIVERAFVAAADSDTVEIDLDPDADDEPDLFERVIDPGQVMVEELTLSLEPYPRAPGAGPVGGVFAPPGAEPLDDDAVKPFAGLAALRDKLEGN